MSENKLDHYLCYVMLPFAKSNVLQNFTAVEHSKSSKLRHKISLPRIR